MSLECQICNATYEEKKDFKYHIARCPLKVKTIYKCEDCNKRFSRKTHLDSHFASSIHGGSKEFNCNICQKKFTFNHGLKRHIRLVHEKINNFDCDIVLRHSVYF